MHLELRNVGVTFASGVQAVTDVDLTVADGQFVAIVGPSGCGKSTLLNAIAGLLDGTHSGQILIDGRDVRARSDRGHTLGYVFQRDSLLPWRTVVDNIATGLEIRGVGRAERLRRTSELVEMVGLHGFEHAFPHQLSGGMRQRVSLARTLAYQPRLILMDEPFGALDAHTRLDLQAELLRIWERTRTSILFVTHDLGEAILLAQQVVLLSQRPGTIRRVYDIDLPYPRDPVAMRADARFGGIERALWRELRHEYRLRIAA